MRNIVIIAASERVNGNTHALCNAFMEGAKAAGHKVTLFSTAGKTINPCRGCEGCSRNERENCVIEDDMQDFYPLFHAADTIVLGSPLYMWSISGQLKTMLDRLHGIGRQNHGYPKKDCVLLMAAGSPKPEPFHQAVAYYETCPLGYYKWNDLGRILCGSFRLEGDITNNDALKEAYNLGYSLK